MVLHQLACMHRLRLTTAQLAVTYHSSTRCMCVHVCRLLAGALRLHTARPAVPAAGQHSVAQLVVISFLPSCLA